jgi:hypothetical protein
VTSVRDRLLQRVNAYPPPLEALGKKGWSLPRIYDHKLRWGEDLSAGAARIYPNIGPWRAAPEPGDSETGEASKLRQFVQTILEKNRTRSVTTALYRAI